MLRRCMLESVGNDEARSGRMVATIPSPRTDQETPAVPGSLRIEAW